MTQGKHFETVRDKRGLVVEGATVLVLVASSGVKANLFEDDELTPLLNPLTTPENGRVGFMVEAGLYDMIITKTVDGIVVHQETKENLTITPPLGTGGSDTFGKMRCETGTEIISNPIRYSFKSDIPTPEPTLDLDADIFLNVEVETPVSDGDQMNMLSNINGGGTTIKGGSADATYWNNFFANGQPAIRLLNNANLLGGTAQSFPDPTDPDPTTDGWMCSLVFETIAGGRLLAAYRGSGSGSSWEIWKTGNICLDGSNPGQLNIAQGTSSPGAPQPGLIVRGTPHVFTARVDSSGNYRILFDGDAALTGSISTEGLAEIAAADAFRLGDWSEGLSANHYLGMWAYWIGGGTKSNGDMDTAHTTIKDWFGI